MTSFSVAEFDNTMNERTLSLEDVMKRAAYVDCMVFNIIFDNDKPGWLAIVYYKYQPVMHLRIFIITRLASTESSCR